MIHARSADDTANWLMRLVSGQAGPRQRDGAPAGSGRPPGRTGSTAGTHRQRAGRRVRCRHPGRARGGEAGMDQGYDAFCMVDPLFYDTLHSGQSGDPTFATADRPLPDGWQRRAQDDWLVFDPGDVELPLQGWKVHVSACLGNSDRVLDAVWDYCVPRGIEFKFLRSKGALLARVSKYAARGYSGKLVTI